MNQELVLYNENTELEPDRREASLAMVLAMVVGILSMIVAGGSIPGEAADVLPLLAATATPGIFAWVLSYLAANYEMQKEWETEEVVCNE